MHHFVSTQYKEKVYIIWVLKLNWGSKIIELLEEHNSIFAYVLSTCQSSLTNKQYPSDFPRKIDSLMSPISAINIINTVLFTSSNNKRKYFSFLQMKYSSIIYKYTRRRTNKKRVGPHVQWYCCSICSDHTSMTLAICKTHKCSHPIESVYFLLSMKQLITNNPVCSF